jgi:rhodanese-related sulfurtransferase
MPHPFTDQEIEVAPERAAEMIREGVQLVDVRETYEHDEGRIEGARHIELERLAAQAETIDKEAPVLFYCRLGARSAMAAQAFRRAGYQAFTMTGGLTEWHRQGLPLEPEDGTVADH